MADPQPVSIRDLNDAQKLADKRRELEQLRHRDKIDWTLNRRFYEGDQWSFWNRNWPNGGRLETTPTDEGDKPHYKVRLTLTDLAEGAQHYVSQLTKNRPAITGTPNSGSDSDLKAAQLATDLWEYWWQPDQLALEEKVQTSALDAILSQGFWHISWDKFAGVPLTHMVSPEDGQTPLVGDQWTDENLDILREELRNAGLDPAQFERTIMVGDIKVEPLPGENVLLGPGRTFEDVMYAVVTVNMDPDEAAVRWPAAKGAGPDAISGEEAATPQSFKSPDERPKNVRRVYIGYFRPSPVLPRGRIVCWIEGPDKILSDKPWDLPFRELPLVHFPGLEKPNSALDIPRMTAARPLAKTMNKTFSQVVEHQNLTLKPQVLAPVGSLQERLTNEPGRTIYFNPVNGAVPQWRDIPGLPAYVFENLDRLEAKMDRLWNRVATQRDQLPARIDNAGSIDLIHEATSDQITPTIRRLESALVRAGMIMLKLAQQYYTEPRLLKITGPNGSVRTRKFMNADLKGGFSLHAEAGSALPRTRAGKQSRIEFMLANNLIDQRTALKFLDTADMTGLMAKMQAAEEQAYRTIEKLKKGEPLNPVALMQAQSQVQGVLAQLQAGMPVDLDGDGVADDPQAVLAQLQQMLDQAAISPLPHEDPQVHLDVLTTFMDSTEFEALDTELKSQFVNRYSAMLQQMMAIQQAQIAAQHPAEKPKIALQLKATTSAPVAGEILREAGVQVSDQEVAEPPLETWVSDSVDKTDAGEAGNNQLTQLEQVTTIQQSQETHALKLAKAAHEVRLASAKADSATSDSQDGNADARAEELHQQKMRHAEETHQERMRQARQPKKEPAKSGS
jgi:hypothetical protein